MEGSRPRAQGSEPRVQGSEGLREEPTSESPDVGHPFSGRRELVWWLPCGVFCSVEGGALAFGVDVEDVLAAEGVGVGIVLVGAHAPVGGTGHGIDGNAAKELYLFVLDL